jgi:hypothetical protein
MLVLKRPELGVIHSSASVVLPNLISKVWIGLDSLTPTLPLVGAIMTLPGWPDEDTAARSGLQCEGTTLPPTSVLHLVLTSSWLR